MKDIWADEEWEDWTTIKLSEHDDGTLYQLMSKYKMLDYMIQQATVLKDHADVLDIEPMYIMAGSDVRAIVGEFCFFTWRDRIAETNRYYLNQEGDINNRGVLV